MSHKLIQQFQAYFEGKAQIGGITVQQYVDLTTTASPNYTSGDSIGGAVKLEELTKRNKSGIIHSVKAQFEASITPIDTDVYFFAKTPTATDNSAFAATVAEQKFMIAGKVSLLAADADSAIATVQSIHATNLSIPYQAIPETDVGTYIWMVVVVRDALNLATTSGLHMTVGALID